MTATMPLIQEIYLTIADPAPGDLEVYRARHTHGREQELNDIARLLDQQRHVLIVGDRGIGKSHLLLHVRDHILDPERLIFVDEFKAMKSSLRTMAQSLHERQQLTRFRDEEDSAKIYRQLSRWQIADLTTLVCDSLHGHDYVLIIDNLDTLTPTGVTTLQELTQVATILAAAPTGRLDRLERVIERFNRLQLGPVNNDAITAMLWSQIDYDSVSNPKMLERKVLDTAKGNPGAVADVVARYKSGKITLQEIREIKHTGTGHLDLTWILIVAAMLFMAFRYVSRAMDSTTAYIAAGALSVISLVARTLLWRARR